MDVFLKQPNKNSHKISKPIRKPLPLPLQPDPNTLFQGPGRVPPQSQPPAVYNINKNDFRDVVQKLTGSPAHDRQQTPPPPPPPITQPRPPNSRLQRIRPPPLSQIGNRPNQIAQIHHNRPQFDAGQRPPPPPPPHAAETPISAYMRFLQNAPSPLWNGGPRPDHRNEFGQRPSPFSPLHPPAESPISAYMRFFQNSPRPESLMPPNEIGQRPPPPPFSPRPPQAMTPTGSFPFPFAATPLSPMPFGCIPSPRSPYGMMSPGFLFAPMGQQLGFPQLPPLSPSFPVPSPRWKGI